MPATENDSRLVRNNEYGMVAGVCSGIAAGATESPSMSDCRREFTAEVGTAAGRATAAVQAHQAVAEIAAVARGLRMDTSVTSMPVTAAPQTEPGTNRPLPAAATAPEIVTDIEEINPPAAGTQQP